MNYLLHPEIFEQTPVVGPVLRSALGARINDVLADTSFFEQPPLSVLIRSRNEATNIEQLIEEIHQQDYPSEVEVVLVDTESRDGTRQQAKRLGATITSITQDEFNYPLSLNRGLEAASYENVFMTVGHANFSNTLALRSMMRHLGHTGDEVAGAYGTVLPGRNASWVERYLGVAVVVHMGQASKIDKAIQGGFGATGAAIKRTVWEEVGGFDEAYAAGGEDGAMARTMMAKGYEIVREPVLSMHHSHGLGPINKLHEQVHWSKVSKPLSLDKKKLAKHRPDLKLED